MANAPTTLAGVEDRRGLSLYPLSWRARECRGALQIEPQSVTWNLLAVLFLTFGLFGSVLILVLNQQDPLSRGFLGFHSHAFGDWLLTFGLFLVPSAAAIMGCLLLLRGQIIGISTGRISVVTSYVFWRSSQEISSASWELELAYENSPNDVWMWTLSLCPHSSGPMLIAHEQFISREKLRNAEEIATDLSRRSGFGLEVARRWKERPRSIGD
jgi:hypothetical protein